MEGLVLHRRSRMPQTQSPNIVWILTKGAKINLIRDPLFPDPPFIFLPKVPVKGTTSRLLNGSLYVESCPFPEPSFTCISNSPIKVLIKNLTLLSKALGKERPLCSPKWAWPVVYDTAITNPLPCSLQHSNFHLGLGRPEPG